MGAVGHGLLVTAIVAVVLTAWVSFGLTPSLLATAQFLLLPFHPRHSHLSKTAPYFPNVAILLPAWNEAGSLANSIPELLSMDYPVDHIKVVVINDASTDDTVAVLDGLEQRFPGRILAVHRTVGGQGKAAALNAGLDQVLDDDWAQAILITDADVVFLPDTLRKMTRHLVDPEVGAVTCYIKEGSADNHWLSRYVAFEYAVAQAGARRALNVVGIQACLAGGGQLHTRANLEAIGGRIDNSTLAEDTVSTFRTRAVGHKVIFEGNAVVWAEEPASIASLWRQRLRWARGNIQVTRLFKSSWFRREEGTRYGPKLFFDAIWISLLLMPVITATATFALVYLLFHATALSVSIFADTAFIAAACWAFLIATGLCIDPQTSRRSWFAAIRFPGVVTLAIIFAASFPHQVGELIRHSAVALTGSSAWVPQPMWFLLFAYCWMILAQLGAYAAKVLEERRVPFLPRFLLGCCGYGSLLLAVSTAAWFRELRHAPNTWDKTAKSGNVAVDSGTASARTATTPAAPAVIV